MQEAVDTQTGEADDVRRRGKVERADVEDEAFGALSERCVGTAGDVQPVDGPQVVQTLVNRTVATVRDQQQVADV